MRLSSEWNFALLLAAEKCFGENLYLVPHFVLNGCEELKESTLCVLKDTRRFRWNSTNAFCTKGAIDRLHVSRNRPRRSSNLSGSKLCRVSVFFLSRFWGTGDIEWHYASRRNWVVVRCASLAWPALTITVVRRRDGGEKREAERAAAYSRYALGHR